MKWFKHFSNASTSLKLNRLIDELGLEAYAQYWLLLEILSANFDGESTKITLHFSEISPKVRIKFGKKLETFVQKLADFSLLSCQVSGKFYDFDAPILRELMDKDSKYNRKRVVGKSSEATLRYKNKDLRIKNEEERSIKSLTDASGTVELASIAPKKNLPEKDSQEILKAPTQRKTRAPKEAPLTQTTWESFRSAYAQRYGVEPIRNASVNSKIKQFVERLGCEEAPLVAAYYVSHNAQRYTGSAHSVGNMLFDAEKLRTEWARGRQITLTESRATETKQQIVNVFSKHLGGN
jgi:hypothetical protein